VYQLLSKINSFCRSKLLKKNIVTFEGGSKRVLLYYKTDVFSDISIAKRYTHTNNSEILIIVNILKKIGFTVDVVDRSSTKNEINTLLTNQYEVLIANYAGNGAKHTEYIINNFKIKLKIAYCAGPESLTNNFLTRESYDNFRKRNNYEAVKTRRIVIYGRLDENRFSGFDVIFSIGNNFSKGTFEKLYPNIPFYRINPSVSNDIKFNITKLNKKSPNRFLYFGGNGLIVKGLDLILESFDGEDNLYLEIGGPSNEDDFWSFYTPLLERNKNINFNGFMNIHSEIFNDVCQKSSFVIFAGASEGIATSVLTCLRAGLIPVVTYESGIDIDDFGFMIKRDIKNIKHTIRELSNMADEEIKRRSINAHLASLKYSPDGFNNCFEEALINTLSEVEN